MIQFDPQILTQLRLEDTKMQEEDRSLAPAAIQVEDPRAVSCIATVYLQPVNLVALHEALDTPVALLNFGHALLQRCLQPGQPALGAPGQLAQLA